MGACPGNSNDGVRLGNGGTVTVTACAPGQATIGLHHADSSTLLRSYPVTVLPEPPTALSLGAAPGEDDLAVAFTPSGPPHHYQFQLNQAAGSEGTYSLVDTQYTVSSPARFADQARGHWYQARGRNCLDDAGSGCGDWSPWTAAVKLPLDPPTGLTLSLAAEEDDALVAVFTGSRPPHPYQFQLCQRFSWGCLVVATQPAAASPATFDALSQGNRYRVQGRNCLTASRATCGDWGQWSNQVFLDTPPAFGAASYSFSLAEDAATGTAAGTVAANDPDRGDTLTYSITAGNDAGKSAIGSNTGEITVARQLHHDTAPAYVLIVAAQDRHGGANTATITITMTEVSP